ncbi:MAG TPA: putative toxin-antitoxin system toxin component, PIN family [Dehalococcoidia bacterium]|nr:putative toxin-antitoxin system toxin component, PIN family [Dehalococcoidia bacterium]
MIDTGVVVAGIFWRNEPRQCLAALARRRFRLLVTDAILREYQRVVWEVKDEEGLELDPGPALTWIQRKARRIQPVELPQPTCRDSGDDKFLECALVSSGTYLVSRDADLLTLGRPFGIRIVTPRQFLAVLAQVQKRPRR